MYKLSNYQMIIMGSNFIITSIIISLPAQIIGSARQAAWVCYLVAVLFTLLPFGLLAKVIRRFPEKDLFQVLKKRYPFWGTAISILYVLFFFYIFIRDFRMVIDFVSLSLLPRTPLALIAILVMGTCIFAARGGMSVVARMHELFYPVLPLIVVALPFLFYGGMNVRFLKPLLSDGVEPVIHGSWLALSYFGEIIVLPFITLNRTFQYRIGLISLLMCTCMLEVLIILDIVVLGTNITPRLMYPTYELVRQVRITEFLDRFDSILVTLWLPTLFLKLSFTLFIICHGIKEVKPQIQEKVLTTSVGVFAFVCAFWFFENPIQVLNMNIGWTYVAFIFEFVLPIFLFFILKPKYQNV